MSQQATLEMPHVANAKALLCAETLPSAVTRAIANALREAGCSAVVEVCDIDSMVTFNCEEEGCPKRVDPRLDNTALIVLDHEVNGVSGFELLGILRGLPETQNARVIMLGPHGPHDHRSVLAAWGHNVDCYLTRSDFLHEPEVAVAKLQRYAGVLLQPSR